MIKRALRVLAKEVVTTLLVNVAANAGANLGCRLVPPLPDKTEPKPDPEAK